MYVSHISIFGYGTALAWLNHLNSVFIHIHFFFFCVSLVLIWNYYYYYLIFLSLYFCSLGKNGLGQKLCHLSFAGCINITDKTLRKISEAVAGPILNKPPLSCQLDSALELESCSCAPIKVNRNLCHTYPLLSSLKCDGTLLPSCCITCPFLSGPTCQLNTNMRSKLQSKDNFKKFSRTSYLSTKVDEGLSSGCDIMSDCYSSRSDRTLACDKPACSSDKEEKNPRDSPSNFRHWNKGLKHLNLSGCYRITDEGLRWVGQLLCYFDIFLTFCIHKNGLIWKSDEW